MVISMAQPKPKLSQHTKLGHIAHQAVKVLVVATGVLGKLGDWYGCAKGQAGGVHHTQLDNGPHCCGVIAREAQQCTVQRHRIKCIGMQRRCVCAGAGRMHRAAVQLDRGSFDVTLIIAS